MKKLVCLVLALLSVGCSSTGNVQREPETMTTVELCFAYGLNFPVKDGYWEDVREELDVRNDIFQSVCNEQSKRGFDHHFDIAKAKAIYL